MYKVIILGNFIVLVFDRHLPVTKEECQKKLKEEFLKNKHITDIRVIDMLVIKVCKSYFNSNFEFFKIFIDRNIIVVVKNVKKTVNS